jgi:hypothetical protein
MYWIPGNMMLNVISESRRYHNIVAARLWSDWWRLTFQNEGVEAGEGKE